MENILNAFTGILTSSGPFFLLLGLLIFVHELGHFLTAKYFGVRVEVFSLGFGKKIFQKTRGDTTYCISIIPLGGYVKMFGDDPTKEIAEDQKKFSFLHKPIWPRMAIVLAGPLVNFFFAILLFALIGLLGEAVPGTQIGDISSDSSAYTVGFRSGDKINEINDTKVENWKEVSDRIKSSANDSLRFKVSRPNSSGKDEVLTLTTKPERIENPAIVALEDHVGSISGLSPYFLSPVVGVNNPESSASKAGIQNLDLISEIDGNKLSGFSELGRLLKKNSGKTFTIKSKAFFGKGEKPGKSHEVVGWVAPEGVAESELPALFGFNQTTTYLAKVKKGDPADKAGLKVGDRIVSLDGKPITEWSDILKHVTNFKAESKIITFGILRGNENLDIEITPQMTDTMNTKGQEESRFTVGIVPAIMHLPSSMTVLKTSNPFTAVAWGVEKSIMWTKLTLISFLRLIQGRVSAKNVGGIFSIGAVASQSFAVGISSFLKIMAIISINLFVLNLLPIPVLDGGHLVFFTIEALKGAPISLRKMELAQIVGMVLLMTLMLFAMFNDVNKWYSNLGW